MSIMRLVSDNPFALGNEPDTTIDWTPTVSKRDIVDWEILRRSALLDCVPNPVLREAYDMGEIRLMRLSRDSVLPVSENIGIVCEGQIALARFPQLLLTAERAAVTGRTSEKLDKHELKRRKKIGPLIRAAERNYATFDPGDVIEVVPPHRADTMGYYTVAPLVLAQLAPNVVERWKRDYPNLRDRLRRAREAAYQKVSATDGARAEVADFFVRHGMSVSLTLRVRKIDACFECGACEQACEDRYGVKRLSLNGRILGGLDFVDACHTCSDQRCIDPCNFDAISFDVKRKEVIINEANCTGCTMCATACPYDAIEMHELSDAPALAARLQLQGSLAFGDGTPRKAQLRRMASKCDHCVEYEDQACISACPTGALLELVPSDVFAQLPSEIDKQTAQARFDHSVVIDLNKINAVAPFVGGLEVPELGHARAPRKQVTVSLWWTIGTILFAACLIESLLRVIHPGWTLAYLIATRAEGLEADLAILSIGYAPGCALAVGFGYAGMALMISGMAYGLRKRVAIFSNLGSLQAWFDWHVFSGVFGPLFILLHSAAKLDNWVSLGVWSMIATVLSGMVGRYLTTRLPALVAKAPVESIEIERTLKSLGKKYKIQAVNIWHDDYRKKMAHFEELKLGRARNALAAVLWIIREDVTRISRIITQRRAIAVTVGGWENRAVRNEVVRLVGQRALLERQRVLMPHLKPLFGCWLAVHVPMATVMSIVSAIHITLALLAG